MIFSIIGKNWKLILDILVVIAIVFLVFLWNPLNLFGKGLRLQNTANMVSEIREIGELVTAEYYGEVIASNNLREMEIEEPDYFEETAVNYYLDLKNTIHRNFLMELEIAEEEVEKFRNDRKRARRLAKKITAAKAEIISSLADSLYDANNYKAANMEVYDRDVIMAMILYLSENEHKLRTNIRKFIRKESNSKELFVKRTIREVLTREYDNIQGYIEGLPAFEDYLTRSFTAQESFRDFYYYYTGKLDDKTEGRQKDELALIGRGSVKAGFNFGELNEGNFVYDDNRKVIHFYGFKAEILNQDINPWFIPEKRVPGFEILLAEKDVGFEEMKKMKSKCIRLLRASAERAGILEQAQKNGEEALKSFFSLLLNDEISEVVFHQDVLFAYEEDILKDQKISKEELSLIESLVARNIQMIRDERDPVIKKRREELLGRFISDLKGVNDIEGLPAGYRFNYFTRYLPPMLEDGKIYLPVNEEDTLAESEVLASLRWDIIGKDSSFRVPEKDLMYWFEDSLQFMSDYNHFVDAFTAMENELEFIQQKKEERAFFKAEDVEAELTLMDAKVETKGYSGYFLEGDSVYFLSEKKVERSGPLRYPVKVDSIWYRYVDVDRSLATRFDSVENIYPVTLFKKDTVKEEVILYSTLELDRELFELDASIMLSKEVLLANAKKELSRIPVLNEQLSAREIEAMAIRDYILQQNRQYNDVGPVFRLRRKMSKAIERDSTLSRGIKNTTEDISEFFANLRKNI